MTQQQDILIFDRILTVVHLLSQSEPSVSGEVETGEHLSGLVAIDVCHEIIEWWATCHEAREFSEFTIAAENCRGISQDCRLEPLLLPDGRAEHMILRRMSAGATEDDSDKPAASAGIAARQLDQEELPVVAGRVLEEMFRYAGSAAAGLHLYGLAQHSDALTVTRLAPSAANVRFRPVSRQAILSLLLKSEHAISSRIYYFSNLDSMESVLGEPVLALPGAEKRELPVALMPVRLCGQLFGYVVFWFGRRLEEQEKHRLARREESLLQLLPLLLTPFLLAAWPRQGEAVKTLRDVTLKLSSSLDQTDYARPVVEAARELPAVSAAALFNIVNEELLQQEKSGSLRALPQTRIPMRKGLVGEAAYTLRTQKRVSPALEDTGGSVYQLALPVKSFSVLEGKEMETVTGVLYCESDSDQLHSDSFIPSLEVLALFASLASENYQLMQQSLQLLGEKSEQARKLEEKGQELNEFVHAVSHDLKNPLSNMDGFTDLMREDIADGRSENLVRYVSRIQANISVVMKILDDLLQLSRVGRMDTEVEEIAFAELVREIVYDFTHSEKDLAVSVDYATLPERLPANPHRITEVFNNLLNNAVKYADPLRPPKVSIVGAREDKFWKISVTDNGIGIPEDSLEEVFRFGSRLQENTSEGTGAGLAICKKIIETHGGSMWAESNKDSYTTFHFTLPAGAN